MKATDKPEEGVSIQANNATGTSNQKERLAGFRMGILLYAGPVWFPMNVCLNSSC